MVKDEPSVHHLAGRDPIAIDVSLDRVREILGEQRIVEVPRMAEVTIESIGLLHPVPMLAAIYIDAL